MAIIILNWNGWADTLECLESVFRLDHPNFQVIVCDNGSTDGSCARIRDWAYGRLDILPERRSMKSYTRPPVPKPVSMVTLDRAEAEATGGSDGSGAKLVLIENGKNLGFAGGNNVGLRFALSNQFEFVWLVNSDTVVSPGALAALMERTANDPAMGMCGSLLCYYDAPAIVEEAGGCAYYPLIGMARRLLKDKPAHQPVDWARIEGRLGYVSGASCLVSRAFLQDVGLMEESYFLYCEEIDWAIRGKGLYRLGLAPQSVVFHKKGRSTGSKSYGAGRSRSSEYYLWRARVRVARRYHKIGLPGLIILALFSIAIALIRSEKASAAAILNGVLDRQPRLSAGPEGDRQSRGWPT